MIRDEVLDLAKRVPRDPAQQALPSGLVDAEVEAFESRTGLRVPRELRDWLDFTNGPRIGMGGVFGISPPDEWLDIERYYSKALFPEWVDKGWIPVASDGCGQYYVLATLEEDGPGHPVFFIEPRYSSTRALYVAASDLWHFLRFYLGFELGERDWPHDARAVLSRDPKLSDYSKVPKAWEIEDEKRRRR